MRLLVDGDSLADHPELEYLLSFEKVEGFSVDSRIAIVDRPGREPCAVIGEAGTHLVSIPPPDQTRRLAAKIASSPSCMIEPEPIARAIALDHVGSILKADLVVSAVAGKIPASDAKFFRRGKFVSVPEALAVVGTYVREIPFLWREARLWYKCALKCIGRRQGGSLQVDLICRR